MFEDEWMNPQMTQTYSSPVHPDDTFYVIQRKRRIPVSGNVAFIEEWRQWAEYETKSERDAELERLRETTDWHLRGRQVEYLGDRVISRDPFEYRDQ